jgi:hypothetical protein
MAALAHRAELLESIRLEQEGVTRIVVKEE